MRRILMGLLAAVLTLGLLAASQAEAKVYKMKPEERAAALKEKKARKARKKAGKANEEAPGGWVEVKPGTKPERKARKSAKVDEIAKKAELKGKKGKKADEPEARAEEKAGKKSGRKAEKAAERKSGKKEARKAERKTGKQSRKQAASKGDRLVTKSFSDGAKVHGEGIEVRRPGAKPHRAQPAAAEVPEASAGPASASPAAPKGDDLSGYSVKRPGQDKAPAPTPAAAPEVRQQVQPGPADAAKPVSSEQKTGEGRF